MEIKFSILHTTYYLLHGRCSLTKRTWKINLVIILMILARLFSSLLLFREFFYDRMLNVFMIFLIYVSIDCYEGLIAIKTGRWIRVQKILEDFTGAVALFVVISGILLYTPLFSIFFWLGFDIEDILYTPIFVWLVSAAVMFAIFVIISYEVRRRAGYFALFLARTLFLIYCLWRIWRDDFWLTAILLIIPLICYLKMEYFVRENNWRNFFKKDPRF